MNITEGFAFWSEVLLWPHQWKWWCWGRICPTAPWSAPRPRSAGTGDPWTPHTAAGTHCWSLHEYWGNASVYWSESAGRNRPWQSVTHKPVRVIAGMCSDDAHLCVRKRRLRQIHLTLLVLTQPLTQTQRAREENSYYWANITAVMKHYHGKHSICLHVKASTVRMIKPMNFSDVSSDYYKEKKIRRCFPFENQGINVGIITYKKVFIRQFI